ncbi:MAG: flagellar biosynthetic protein FliO [Planctomycetota bacterium]
MPKPQNEGETNRRLAPPSRRQGAAGDASIGFRAPGFGDLGLDAENLTTAGAGLAVVIGLVLMLAWAYRRAAPRSARPLPDEVVTVLGRAPLAGKQVTQLVKVGNKLLLVALTPEGPKTLTEVTDPEEVTRLLGLCEQAHGSSATAAFQEVFDQIIREPAAPGFLGDEASLIDRRKLADAYANTPGGRAYE